VNRVGDDFHDQLERSGHAWRESDLNDFARLGIRTVRYPLLWERIAPDGLAAADWSWADRRISWLNALELRPILGLVHHGSGPRSTNLLDPGWPEQLARFARAVAERYPWVADYTPVNEPLTTARFSALYGLWYPHHRDLRSFARALMTECRGTVLAMEAIREVVPHARLVQTEDLGRIYSRPQLAEQAQYENHRRLLSLDLLCGRVQAGHPLWQHLQDVGIERAELDWLVEHAAPPDVVGINYYLTSDRYLDERIDRYPACAVGGNGRQVYVDVEAVRARAEGIQGHRALLSEIWERYHLPLALTEVHAGCSREEQLRWFSEAWRAATRCRDRGMDVRAVTAWSLLGAYDWHVLVTRAEGHYEPGAFDLRAPRPRRTAIAAMISTLAAGTEYAHPVLATSGWWRRRTRLPGGTRAVEGPPPVRRKAAPPILITGATGTLGQAFLRACSSRALPCRLLNRAQLDIAQPAQIEAVLREIRPWAVINTAGYVRVDDAEREPERCHRENAEGAAALAAACSDAGIELVSFSSDLVFGGGSDPSDGGTRRPYRESDPVAPLGVYGASKAAAERAIAQHHPAALVVRTAAFFGPWDSYNFVTGCLRQLQAGQPLALSGEVVSPTYVPDLTNAVLDLLIDGEAGLWHLTNQGATSWANFARLAARLAGADPSLVTEAAEIADSGRMAARPRYSALASERGTLLPPLEDALRRYLQQCSLIGERLRAA
jgi:dTDP-4-dehydrorhamnose reductase